MSLLIDQLKRRVWRPAGAAALCTAALAVLAMSPAPAEARIYETNFRGQWTCKDRGEYLPMGGVRVEIYRRDTFADVKVGQTWTDNDGAYRFRTRTKASDSHDFYPKVPLDGLTLRPFVSSAYKARFQVDYVTDRDFGVATIEDNLCAVWLGFVRAQRDYHAATGTTSSGGFESVVYGAPNNGVPYALYDHVSWPWGYPPSRHPGGFDTVRHEFAHTVRHTLDGDPLHWLADVAVHGYAKHHDQCTHAKPGFAFNEGWAKYWAGDATAYRAADGTIHPPCNPPDDMHYEGNVAAALENLAASCKLTRGGMVDVLRRNRGSIHSFDEFRAAANCSTRALGSSLVVDEDEPARLSLNSQLKLARAQEKHVVEAIYDARRELARTRATCVKPCALEVKETLLRGELEQAKLLERNLAVTTSRPKLLSLRRQPLLKQARTIRELSASYRKAAVRIGRRTLADASAIARRVPGGAQIVRSLGALRAQLAQRGGVPSALLPRAATPVARAAGPTPPSAEPGPEEPPPGPGPEEPPPGPGPQQQPEFADWTGVSGNVASGTLRGGSISLSGSHVTDPPGSNVDGSSTVFDRSDFTPALAKSDAIHFSGNPGYSYTLQFGSARRDPVLHLGSLASVLEFPAGTQITRVSGDAEFGVSGSSVTGGVQGSDDANGTVRLNGDFTSVSFSATPTYSGPPDGIYVQVGS